MTQTFDLTSEPWIPVRRLDANLESWSLRDTLERASQARAIEYPSPLVEAALHRLLLAVLHRALEGPEDAEQAASWYLDGFPVGKIAAYLDRWHDRFDLFGDDHPFYQVPDFTSELSSRSWTVLAPERNSDNNKVLFDHTPIDPPSLIDAAEAARLLVATQTFVLGGGNSRFKYTSTAPDATGAMAMAVGRTLHETLCLNLVSYPPSQHANDMAWWERAHAYTAEEMRKGPERGQFGLVDRYTWPSRSVRLFPEVVEGGALGVRRIAFASGVRFRPDVFTPDVMTAYRPRKDGTLYAVRLRADKAPWRDLDAMIPNRADNAPIPPRVVEEAATITRHVDEEQGRSRREMSRVRIVVVGQVTNKAKVELWRREDFVLPQAVTANAEAYQAVKRALEIGEGGARALEAGVRRVADDLPGGETARALLANVPAVPRYWRSLERAYPTFLDRLPADLDPRTADAAVARWHEGVAAAADDAWHLVERALGRRGEALAALAAGRARMRSKLPKPEVPES